MNYLYVSPNFPYNYIPFATALAARGVKVLGIGDAPFHELRHDLKAALTEYYRVESLEDYDAILRGVGYLLHRHGRINFVESFNEHWLMTDARLREDFNVPGARPTEMLAAKQKSKMKEVFRRLGLAVAAGSPISTPDEARAFAKQHGFPLVLKPDDGVGAAGTFKASTEAELEAVLAVRDVRHYFIEQFVEGTIYTYDGLTDREGHIVFENAMVYSEGIMEVVLRDDHVFYHTLRDIPPELHAAGRAICNAYDIRNRFFHYEFIKNRHDNKLYALEVNMRPPGGITVNMFCYANDLDIFDQYASVVTGAGFTATATRPWFACYVSRKDNIHYAYDRDEMMRRLGDAFCMHYRFPQAFRDAIGDDGYIVRATTESRLHELIDIVHKRA